jgi:CheY-like chemotaxis protein
MGRHEIAVELPNEPVYLDADPVRLAQVLGNLLHNACKFTDPGGHVALSAKREGRELVLVVSDDGIGLAPDQIEGIFEMFVQADKSLERARGGLGIGLTLTRRLVELHGGTITARSAGPGAGSSFEVRLPIVVDEPTAPPPPPPSAEPRAASRGRVLVVDDNRDSAESLAMLLSLRGHDTHTAHDGEEALRVAATVRPDVMLLDIGLPKLNGYDTCRKIRAEGWGRRMVIIALTGWGQDEDRRLSREAGFDGHLVKPVDDRALEALLEKSIGG